MTELQIEPGSIGHLTAAADYSAENTARGLACIQTNQTAVLVSALGQRPIGIMQEDVASGSSILVATSGVWPVRYGATVVVGDDLVAAANGRLIPKTAVAAGSGPSHVIAKAIYAGSDGEFHGALINPPAFRNGPTVIPFAMSAIEAATVNKLTAFPIGALFGSGRITRVDGSITTTLVGASGAVAVNVEIDTVDVTGGVVSFAIGTPTVGTFVAGTAVTAANAFVAASTIDIEWVVTTAFTAGAVIIYLTIS